MGKPVLEYEVQGTVRSTLIKHPTFHKQRSESVRRKIMRFTYEVQVIIVNIHTTFRNQEEGYHSSKPLGEKQILKNNDN